MIYIQINPSLRTSLNPELLKRAAQRTLAHQPATTDADLTIVLTDDNQVRELNRGYRGADATTDVLSFPAHEKNPENGASYLGDVLISAPRADEQASAAGHSLEVESQLLVVHGVLHLLGYDHAEADEKARMWAAQSEILASLGLDNIIT